MNVRENPLSLVLLVVATAFAVGGCRTVKEVAAGDYFSCARLDDGAVKCWGTNLAGNLGLGDTDARGDQPNEMGAQLAAVDLGSGRKAVSIDAGFEHACAVLDNGVLKCWGANAGGQLGLGISVNMNIGDEPGEMGDALPAIDLGTGRTAVAVSAGYGHTCAVLDNGSVKCWGSNSWGQLGTGDPFSHGGYPNQMGNNLPAVDLGTGRTALAVQATEYRSCALLDNHTVKCWGDTIGDTPGELGNNLAALDFGAGRTVKAFSSGGFERHSCAVLDNDTVKCWGENSQGVLGDPLAAIHSLGTRDPVELGTGRTARMIATGGEHTCALLDDKSVKCWGRSNLGQLGLGDTDTRGDDLNEMGDTLAAVNLGGRTPVSLSTGYAHTCALLDDGAVACWGDGAWGALGSANENARGDEPGEMGASLPLVSLF